MPSAEQILGNLQDISNRWQLVAIFWHVYFGVFIAIPAMGLRPSKRIAGLLLGLPILSVSAIAWSAGNPFNGAIFAFTGIIFLFMVTRLQRGAVHLAPQAYRIPGILLFIFGWVYPHFLENPSWLAYLYAAPTGTIPCPTLSIVIGAILILDGLASRALCVLLAIAGLLYGIIGVVQLQVIIDGVLISGSIAVLICAFANKWHTV
jgi:hypothetical protein